MFKPTKSDIHHYNQLLNDARPRRAILFDSSDGEFVNRFVDRLLRKGFHYPNNRKRIFSYSEIPFRNHDYIVILVDSDKTIYHSMFSDIDGFRCLFYLGKTVKISTFIKEDPIRV